MPHISLSLYKGRSKEEISRISQSLEECLIKEVGWSSDDISVSVKCVEPDEFVTLVKKNIEDEELIRNSNLI